MATREVVERTKLQGVDERIAYTIDTTNWVGAGNTPTSPLVVAKNADTLADLTTDVFPSNTPTVSVETITLDLLRDLTAGTRYRIETQFTFGGNLFECYFFVECEV